MPCRSAYDDESWDGGTSSSNASEIRELNEKNRELEAMMCALMNTITISHPHIMDEIINEAENAGEVDIRSWFNQHYQEDIKRLEKKLKKEFSLHERALIKRILNK